MSDGSGCTITGDDFNVEHPNGASKSIPWTLANYLQVSGIGYPSRARLYCVHIPPSDDQPSDLVTSPSEASSLSDHSVCDDDGKTVPQEGRIPTFIHVSQLYKPLEAVKECAV